MPLFIRADASAQLGTGHVMRMLALAGTWRAAGGGAVTFLCAEIPAALEERVRASAFSVVRLDGAEGPAADAAVTLAAIQKASGECACRLVVDGYRFPAEFQQPLRAAGLRLLVMDDNGENQTYACDAILNQNIDADESCYLNRAPGTRLLLGSRYALLRPEFLHARDTISPKAGPGLRVLVTFGGSDPVNATGRLLESLALLERPGDNLTVVIGAGNPRTNELDAILHRLHWGSVQMLRGVTDMASVMSGADLAITAGGSTCWELCLLGVPMLVFSIADNQQSIMRGLAAAGAAVAGGDAQARTTSELAAQVGQLLAAEGCRASLAARASTIVDGRGTERVCAVLKDLGAN